MKNKKGGYDLQNHIITFILVSAILVTFGVTANSMTKSYSAFNVTESDSSFSSTYNKIEDISGDIEDTQNKLESSDVGDTDSDTQFLGGALSAIKIVLRSLTLALPMVTDMATVLGIPLIWVDSVIAIIIVLVVTTILFMVFKSRGT